MGLSAVDPNIKTAMLNLAGFDDILTVDHISTSSPRNMMHRIKLMFICLNFAIATFLCAHATAQDLPSSAEEISILQPSLIEEHSSSKSNPISTSSTDVVVDEVAPVAESAPDAENDAPIIIHCVEDFFENNEQCVVIKKSVLGCTEGITILPQDEVWFVNARECICGETDLSLLKVSQLIDSNLVPRELSDLTNAHASGDEFATVLYVHGNQTNEEYAMARGLQVYRNAITTKSHCHGPVRYVIWAWKSEQEKVRFYPDYLVKSDRSMRLGETFAATLNQFSDRNIVVFGYSLGVQVVLSAFDSSTLIPRDGDPTRYQVAFAAPAINPEFVARNLLKPECTSIAQQTLVFTNRKDRAIRAAQAIIRRKNPDTEPTIAGLSESGKLNLGPVTSIDVFDETGRFHSIERYTRSGTLQSELANLVNEVLANRSQFSPLQASTPQMIIESPEEQSEAAENQSSEPLKQTGSVLEVSNSAD